MFTSAFMTFWRLIIFSSFFILGDDFKQKHARQDDQSCILYFKFKQNVNFMTAKSVLSDETQPMKR